MHDIEKIFRLFFSLHDGPDSRVLSSEKMESEFESRGTQKQRHEDNGEKEMLEKFQEQQQRWNFN